MDKLVPFEKNHELHGGLLGVGVSLILTASGRPFSESLTIGGTAGLIATAYMKSFGHPDFLKQHMKNK